MNQERDKFLTEAIGCLWHQQIYPDNGGSAMCSCGSPAHCCYYVKNDDFSTWTGFGKLWEWSSVQPWWADTYPDGMIPEMFIQPDVLSTAVYQYLKEKDKS